LHCNFGVWLGMDVAWSHEHHAQPEYWKLFLTLSLIGNILLWVVMDGLLYVGIFARVFVVVESSISLRSVPIGVYAEVPWADFIPHIWPACARNCDLDVMPSLYLGAMTKSVIIN
jgi:hypothetical protein